MLQEKVTNLVTNLLTKATTLAANLGKSRFGAAWSFPNSKAEGEAASPGSRDGKNPVGRQPALFVSVSLSLFPRLGLKLSSQGKEEGHLPLSGEFVPDKCFPSTEPACPPAPRQPCLAFNTSSTPRDFLGRHQLGPNPISLRRRGTFLEDPTSFPHLLPPPRGAAMRAGGSG